MMTDDKLVIYLKDAIWRLSYVSGIAMGLAQEARRDEILKLVNDIMAFTAEVEIYLKREPGRTN